MMAHVFVGRRLSVAGCGTLCSREFELRFEIIITKVGTGTFKWNLLGMHPSALIWAVIMRFMI